MIGRAGQLLVFEDVSLYEGHSLLGVGVRVGAPLKVRLEVCLELYPEGSPSHVVDGVYLHVQALWYSVVEEYVGV